jgi:hypothetical protein
VNRRSLRLARLAGVLVVAGLVAVACGRGSHPARNPAQPTQAPTVPAVQATATAEPTLDVLLEPSPTAAASPSDTPSVAPVATYSAPPVASDPVTDELGTLDQLIGNLDGDISGSNAGGE